MELSNGELPQIASPWSDFQGRIDLKCRQQNEQTPSQGTFPALFEKGNEMKP
jgi:hypothetical protein